MGVRFDLRLGEAPHLVANGPERVVEAEIGHSALAQQCHQPGAVLLHVSGRDQVLDRVGPEPAGVPRRKAERPEPGGLELAHGDA